MSMIRELLVENYKKVRVVEVRPDGRIVELTGRNGQGKTSVLDSIWFAFKGIKALPKMKNSVVRKGAEKTRVRVGTDDFVVTRTLGRDGAQPTLTIEMAPGKKRDKTPQEFLDDFLGRLTFDPVEFMSMDPADQVEELKKASNVAIDFEAIATANDADFAARRDINRDVKQLEARLAQLTKLEGLPAEKIDTAAILAKINATGETMKAKAELSGIASRKAMAAQQNLELIQSKETEIERLERDLELAKQARKAALNLQRGLENEKREALRAFENAPSGDTEELTQELQNAQRTNRAIEEAEQHDATKKELDGKRREADQLTRKMETREEEKRTALAKAKMPVEGLTFDENGVQFKGVPLENMGEGEQLRIAAEIGMAANPKLRVLCIRRGEALDDVGMKLLAELAESRDFQLWITRVDSSGKVGIVLEDGMVVAHAD